MRAALPIALVLTLAACATPQQQCINTATHDLRVVDGLIAQLQTDIARGYGTTLATQTSPEWRMCGGHFDRPGRRDEPHMCFVDVTSTVSVPVAINLDEAQRTLASLKRKRESLVKQANAGVAQCQAQYPDQPAQ